MSDTYQVTVGNKGRIVVPAAVREAHAWREGTTLIAIESAAGLAIISREMARDLVERQLAGRDLVEELLLERRAEADADSRPGAPAA